MSSNFLRCGIPCCVFLLVSACGGDAPPVSREPEAPAVPERTQMAPAAAARGSLRAIARMEPASGSSVRGAIVFTAFGGSMVMGGALDGGTTVGPRAIHIHEVGDCSAPDATSAGPHFNPDDAPHGSPDAAAGERHAGDLGNVTFAATGQALFSRILGPGLTFEGERGILGRSVIVHAGPDDFVTQPTGNAGSRIACGVIEKLD